MFLSRLVKISCLPKNVFGRPNFLMIVMFVDRVLIFDFVNVLLIVISRGS